MILSIYALRLKGWCQKRAEIVQGCQKFVTPRQSPLGQDSRNGRHSRFVKAESPYPIDFSSAWPYFTLIVAHGDIRATL
jgi:hypothetical protein